MILKGPHVFLNPHHLMKTSGKIMKSKVLGYLMEPRGGVNDGQEELHYEPLH